MKDQNKSTNNERFTSPLNKNEFDPEDVLVKIQDTLREYTYEKVEHTSLSDALLEEMTSFGLLLDGLCYHCQNSVLGDYLDDDMLVSLTNGFFELKKLVNIREDEHSKIFYLALHGTKDVPAPANTDWDSYLEHSESLAQEIEEIAKKDPVRGRTLGKRFLQIQLDLATKLLKN